MWCVLGEDHWEAWFWRPLIEGYCKYESMINGTLGLEDIATMNDLIDFKHENEKRYRRHMESKSGH